MMPNSPRLLRESLPLMAYDSEYQESYPVNYLEARWFAWADFYWFLLNGLSLFLNVVTLSAVGIILAVGVGALILASPAGWATLATIIGVLLITGIFNGLLSNFFVSFCGKSNSQFYNDTDKQKQRRHDIHALWLGTSLLLVGALVTFCPPVLVVLLFPLLTWALYYQMTKPVGLKRAAIKKANFSHMRTAFLQQKRNNIFSRFSQFIRKKQLNYQAKQLFVIYQEALASLKHEAVTNLDKKEKEALENLPAEIAAELFSYYLSPSIIDAKALQVIEALAQQYPERREMVLNELLNCLPMLACIKDKVVTLLLHLFQNDDQIPNELQGNLLRILQITPASSQSNVAALLLKMDLNNPLIYNAALQKLAGDPTVSRRAVSSTPALKEIATLRENLENAKDAPARPRREGGTPITRRGFFSCRKTKMREPRGASTGTIPSAGKKS